MQRGKPNLMRSMQLPEIKAHRYERYLPTAFDESLSILEKVNKVIQYLHEYSEITEMMMEKWNEVYEWLLGEGLDEALEGRLEEMLDNGEFEDLLSKLLLHEYARKEDLETLKTEMEELSADLIRDVNKMITEVERSVKERLDKMDKVKLDTTNYYKDITVEKFRDDTSNTSYYLTVVPPVDRDGAVIRMRNGLSHDDINDLRDETVRDFSVRKKSTLVTNGGLRGRTGSGMSVRGMFIKEGKVEQDIYYDDTLYILAFDQKRNMRTYPPKTSAQTILNDGYTEAVATFAGLINNGVKVSDSIIGSHSNATERHPRQLIGKDRAGNICFITTEGRRFGEYGMTSWDAVRVALKHGFEFAQMLDGGGSSQTVLYHSIANRLVDSRTKPEVERPRASFLHFTKENIPKGSDPTTDLLATQGQLNKLTRVQITQLDKSRYQTNNQTQLTDFLKNGWKTATSGQNRIRGWHFPNQSLTLHGAVYGTKDTMNIEEPFLKLPSALKPNFTTYHLVTGKYKNEIFRVTIHINGNMTLRWWSDEARANYYAGGTVDFRLDGIIIPTNPMNIGV